MTRALPTGRDFPGGHVYAGRLLDGNDWTGPRPLAGLRVVVVGDGPEAERIARELAPVARVSRATRRTPQPADTVPLFWRFTEDGVVWQDGREEWVDAVVWCDDAASSEERAARG